MREREKRTEITVDQVVKEIAALAFSRMTDFVKFDGKFLSYKSFDELNDGQLAAFQTLQVKRHIEKTSGGGADGQPVDSVTIKLADKTKNLELLGRHLGMFRVNDLVADDKPEEHELEFHQLPYEDQINLVQLAIDTMPRRLKPPEIHQGDQRPEGLEDMDAGEA